MITAELLTKLGVHDAATWSEVLEHSCARNAITSRLRVAAFLARTLQETIRYARLVESFDYTPERLLQVFPAHFTPENAQRLGRTAAHPADQHAIAEAAYGGRLGNGPAGSGDGWLYRGRGLIQLTGKANYQAFATKIGVPLTELPALLQLPGGAADSAAAYWTAAGCNEAADRGDIDAVVRLVNGGTNGLADTKAL